MLSRLEKPSNSPLPRPSQSGAVARAALPEGKAIALTCLIREPEGNASASEPSPSPGRTVNVPFESSVQGQVPQVPLATVDAFVFGTDGRAESCESVVSTSALADRGDVPDSSAKANAVGMANPKANAMVTAKNLLKVTNEETITRNPFLTGQYADIRAWPPCCYAH